ncbi:MAG: transglutaminase-like domain-containing protein, partial [Planctomycetota bacterium]
MQQSNPRAIALRVNSDTQPGYLRSRVFDRYSEGGWRIDQRNDGLGIRRLPTIETQNTTALLAPRSASQQTYRLRNMAGELRSRPDMPSRLRSFRVMNDPDRPGRHHFLPLDAVHIQGWGSGVVADEYGMIRGGLNRRSPYFFAAAPRLQPMNLRPERRASLLQRPLVSRAVVASIASQLFRPGESPRAKAAAVSNYFQANYQYSLSGVRRPSNADPLEYFLQQRHPAHCEYFATATAALLRHGGVPCRYAVGFVVDEYNDETERWVARNSDAHSWVEAFDDRTGTWFIVESTPGRSVDDSRFNDRNANTDGPAADAEITVAAGSEIYQQFLAWWYGLTFSDIAGLARVMRTPLIVMTCIVLAIV